MVAVQIMADEEHLYSEVACEDIVVKGNVAHIRHGGVVEKIEFVKYSRKTQDDVLVYNLYVNPPAEAEPEADPAPEAEAEPEGTPLPFEAEKEEEE